MYTPGHFDRQGNPCTQIEVRGLDGRKHTLDDVVIDTGFSGFLQMPKSLAAVIRLEDGPMVESTLADNRKITMETAYGTVDFQRYSRRGVIMLSATLPRVLAGMDFLRIFRLALVVFPPSEVALIDQNLASDLTRSGG